MKKAICKLGWYKTDDFVVQEQYVLRKGHVVREKYGRTPKRGIYKASSLSIKDGDSGRNFFKNPKTYKYSFWQNEKVFVSLKYETKHNRF